MKTTEDARPSRYWAFISYSHDDEAIAKWLHRALETYRLPAKLVGTAPGGVTIPQRLHPIFRDRDELASAASLGREILQALTDSHALIVIASRRSAKSKWVNEEIRQFKMLGRSHRLVSVILDGEPDADDPNEECFAPALRYTVGGDGELTDELAEPIAADIRPGRGDRKVALLQLVAGILGLGLDDLRQRDQLRRQRRLTLISIAAVVVATMAVGLSLFAFKARNEAVEAQAVAVAERELAQGIAGLGAWLYGKNIEEHPNYSGNAESLAFAEQTLKWLKERYPNDESRQAAVLTEFARNVVQQGSDPETFLLSVVQVLGGDYRQKMIDALVAGSAPDRYAMAARLAWFDENQTEEPVQFRELLERAIAEQPDSAEVWNIAAVYCVGLPDARRCLRPDAAERLTALDPDNAFSWLLRSMAGEGSEAREFLRKAAQRDFFDDGYTASVDAYLKAVTAAGVPVPELLAGPARALSPDTPPEFVVGALETSAFPLTYWQPYLRRCNPSFKYFHDATAYEDCRKTGEVMARGKGSLLSSMIGVAAVRNVARGTPLEAEMIQLRKNYLYAVETTDQLSRAQLFRYPIKTFYLDMANQGELAAWKNRLSYYGLAAVPPDDWAPRDPLSMMRPDERRAFLKANPDYKPPR